MTTEATTEPEYPFLLKPGSHPDDSCDVCLLEAVSMGCDVTPQAGMARTDHPDDVCEVRAAFGRALNDAYPGTHQGDIERTRDMWPLICALRGTAARKDGRAVAEYLATRAIRDWFPRSLSAYSAVLREDGSAEAARTADVIDGVVAKNREIYASGPADRVALVALVALAARADLVARVALADLADRADRAARAARVDLVDLVALVARVDLVALVARVDLVAQIRVTWTEIRRDQAAALLATCAPGWTSESGEASS